MAWQDRLQEAKVTSPLGSEFVFIYENVSKSFDIKGTVFNFPDANGSYAQGLGFTGTRYPLQLIFSGSDYDLLADAFEDAIKETGTFRLDHPVYGSVNVVPIGKVSRTDNLKTSGNQAVFTLSFFDTINEIYPIAQVDGKATVKADLLAFNKAQADDLEDKLKLGTELDRQTFLSRFKNRLDTVKSGFQIIVDAQKKVSDKFNDVYNSINGSLNILVFLPATLAFQTAILLQTPGLLAESLKARLDGYKNIIDGLTVGDNKTQIPGLGNSADNNFQNDKLYADSAISGYVNSVINFQFDTKTQALETAEELLIISNQVNTWREENNESLGILDTGESYQAIQKMVADTVGFLVQISFTLKQEIFLTLDRDRTFIDLCAELYGNVEDETLDFFINTNNLSGSEYLEIKKGKQVVYYV